MMGNVVTPIELVMIGEQLTTVPAIASVAGEFTQSTDVTNAQDYPLPAPNSRVWFIDAPPSTWLAIENDERFFILWQE